MGTTGNGYQAEDLAGAGSPASVVSAEPGKSDRRTVRGVPDEVWARVVKGMELTGASQGQWISDAITAKFSEDLQRSRVPATIQPQVTTLMADVTPLHPIDQAPPAEPANGHLAVLQAVAAFAQAPYSDAVQRAAERVIIDRCKLLLEGRRAPSLSKRQRGPARLTDDIPSGDEIA
jgi:hypothetical protein